MISSTLNWKPFSLRPGGLGQLFQYKQYMSTATNSDISSFQTSTIAQFVTLNITLVGYNIWQPLLFSAMDNNIDGLTYNNGLFTFNTPGVYQIQFNLTWGNVVEGTRSVSLQIGDCTVSPAKDSTLLALTVDTPESSKNSSFTYTIKTHTLTNMIIWTMGDKTNVVNNGNIAGLPIIQIIYLN